MRQRHNMIKEFTVITIYRQKNVPQRDKRLPYCCSHKIKFTVLFHFWNNQGKVIFPEWKAGATTSTNEIREKEDKLEFSHWLFIFWSQAAQIVILSNKAFLACEWGKLKSCGPFSSTLSKFSAESLIKHMALEKNAALLKYLTSWKEKLRFKDK